MKTIFSEFEVTPEFVLDEHNKDPTLWETKLTDLDGRQKINAKNVVLAAATTVRLCRVPRDSLKSC
jgi:hypothetical protein